MPYSFGRKYRKYRKMFRGRGRSHYVSSAKSLVQYKYNKPEPKYKDGTSTNAVSTPLSFFCTAIDQGTAQSQRIGNQISKYALRLNYVTSPNASATSGVIMRVMVIEDKFPNKTALTATQLATLVLTNPNPTTAGVVSPAIPENFDRFRVYYDQQHMIAPPTQDLSVTPHNVVVPIKSSSVYTGSTCADGSTMTRGALYVLILPSVGSAGPSLDIFWRLIYNDN